MKKENLLAIDQGTTSSRAIIFSLEAKIIATAQQEFPNYYPHPAWVEQRPEDIWQTVLSTCQQAIKNAKLEALAIAGIGISVQRETTLLWDRKTGKTIYPAIVWQDRRTTEFCEQLTAAGHEALIHEKTGLLLDPYFSASKIHWLLENIPEARQRAEAGELAFGTVDTYLIWQLTEGRVHATDASNASRTLLFNIHQQAWDQDLLKIFNIPAALLPEVKNSSDDFGSTLLFGSEIPIAGNAGDQQCASIGQACFSAGDIKTTYGTGCFMMQNTGEIVVQSQHRLLSTVAYRLKNKTTYATEGSIFIAGAAVQWLRDAMHLISNAKDTESIAESITSTDGVYLVPAFTGLGAPYWDPQARGAILGLTRDSGVAHIVRAALEAICYQSRDLFSAMQQDNQQTISLMKVDGGMVNNNWLMQFLADILQIEIGRSAIVECSALGAAFLAGLSVGVYQNLEQISQLWRQERLFTPSMSKSQVDDLYQGWQAAVQSVLSAPQQ